jgi:UDP-N-acetylglucosamine 2-epimerase (non-hydrolysing)
MKVMTILGTRPEIIKLSRIIPELDHCFEHVLVHTGQNYAPELSGDLFAEFKLCAPDVLVSLPKGVSTVCAIGLMTVEVDAALEKHRPDAVLVLGDTNSALTVYAAKRRRIPIFHMEAGNRCFDERVPEEVNRRLVDHMSDVNLVYTEHARRNLLREGFAPDRIVKTGSPMLEVLWSSRARGDAILDNLGLAYGSYYVLAAHREENVDDPARLRRVTHIAEELGRRKPVIFSVHPRTEAVLEALGWKPPAGVRTHAPFGFADYLRLQTSAACVISDSGTLAEESALLRVPAVTIRDAHERPESADSATLVRAGLDPREVLEAVALVERQHGDLDPLPPPPDYAHGKVSARVVRTIQSFTSYVRRAVYGV